MWRFIFLLLICIALAGCIPQNAQQEEGFDNATDQSVQNAETANNDMMNQMDGMSP